MIDNYAHRARKALCLALAGIVAACSSGAMLAGHVRRTGMQIDVSDLDLRTSGGQLALHHRIVLAARRLCGPNDYPGQVAWDVYRICVQEAMADAAPQMLSLVAAAPAHARYADSTARK